MANHYFLILFAVFSTCLSAQGEQQNTFIPSQPVSFTAEEVLDAAPLFELSPSTELRRVYTYTSPSGRQHVKYHQFQDGMQVLGSTVVFHLDGDLLLSATGGLTEVKQTRKDFQLSASQAEQLAHLWLSYELNLTEDLRAAKTIRSFANSSYPRQGGTTVAVYIVNLKADIGPAGLPVDTEVIVNATSGRVMTSLSNIHSETVIGHGDGFYRQDISFPVDSISPDEFALHDESRGEGIFAHDITNGFRIPTDEDNVWESDLEGHQAMVDGYFASVKFYDFLQARFNRNSLDDEGFPLVANMNRHNFVNAFWDGTSTTYGNGNCDSYSPLPTFDLVGHEFAHGLTEFTSGLIYQDESGALNESISDIFGKAFQFYYDNDHFDWRVAGIASRRPDVPYFRDMADPSLRDDPKFYKGENWHTSALDNGGVHVNSGVFNFWFYLLVEGQQATNEAGDAYDVRAIGMDSAIQLVYLLETAYLTENSVYADCYDFSLLAAEELFGVGSQAYNSVTEAWKAVGMPAEPDDDNDTGVVDVDIDNVIMIGAEDAPFRYRFCPVELDDISYRVENLPDTASVPYGSILSGFIAVTSFTDNGIIEDTIRYPEVVTSPDNYSELGEMQLGIDYPQRDALNLVRLRGSFELYTERADTFAFTTFSFMLINKFEAPELLRNEVSYGEPCNLPEVTDEVFEFHLPRCNGPAGGLIRAVYTNGPDELVHEVSLDDIVSPTLTFQPSAVLDLTSLSSLNGTRLVISYVKDGEETVLITDDYSPNFSQTIEEPTVYSFDDTTAAKVGLGINLCEDCPNDFGNEALNINDGGFIFGLETCIPTNEYISEEIRKNSQDMSKIYMCVNTEEINEPILVFTVNQERNFDFSNSENQYLRMVDVRDEANVSLLEAPITGTDNDDLAVEIPLPQDFNGLLTMYVISRDLTTTIDDIGVKSAIPSSTRRLGPGTFDFRYANPVSSQLAIWTEQTVPAGTEVRVINTTGQVVGTETMRGNRFEMGTEHLPAGLYFLTISDGSTFSWTGKVVRQ
jgi:Zn-dependent metalloprotease